MKSIPFALLVLCVGGCCRCPQQATGPRIPETPTVGTAVPASRPATQPFGRVRKIMVRMGTHRAMVIQLLYRYLAEEGPTRRGERFAALAINIQPPERDPLRFASEYEYLALLGPPDYVDSDERGSMLIYLFRRANGVMWYVQFGFDANGWITHTGLNGVSEIDLSTYKRFPEWNMAKLPEDGEGTPRKP
jgi:hypothetical protein